MFAAKHFLRLQKNAARADSTRKVIVGPTHPVIASNGCAAHLTVSTYAANSPAIHLQIYYIKIVRQYKTARLTALKTSDSTPRSCSYTSADQIAQFACNHPSMPA